MDIDEQVEYGKTGSAEDLAAAESLLEKGPLRQSLFFAHLALEKMVEAHVVYGTHADPSRLHNLVRLAQSAGLKLNQEQERFLRRFDLYQLEGRYPDARQVVLDVDILAIGSFEGRSVDRSVQIRMKLRPDFPMDLLVRTPEKVRERIEMGDAFMREILEQGKVLYEADHR